jgi:hypothetical protein
MKKVILLKIVKIVFLLVTIVLFSTCKKKAFYNLTCKDKNLTATVDGKPYYSCAITVVNTNLNCWISTNDGRSTLSRKYTLLGLNFPPAVGTYYFGNSTASGNFQIGFINGNAYMTDTLSTGSITVTKYDQAAKLASGTFSFSCTELNGTTIKQVTNGEFKDVKLQ